MSERYWDLEEALEEATWSADEALPTLDAPELRAAALRMTQVAQRLAEEVRRLTRELSWAKARTGQSAVTGAHVRGHTLEEGRSPGGPRHYIDGQPVNAGAPICLLMHTGWVRGRYEWGFEPGTPGRFYFGLPGCYDSVSVAIPAAARVAWPHEFE